jgi:hypothetical protein
MNTDAADDATFILSDEIIDHVNSLFPPTDNHSEKTRQTCNVLQALINAIGLVLYEIDCPDCWELTMKAVESSSWETGVRRLKIDRSSGHRSSTRSIRLLARPIHGFLASELVILQLIWRSTSAAASKRTGSRSPTVAAATIRLAMISRKA